MKNFQKIALVSAMAFSANAMAMQTLDDEALSAATGQDGIAINIKTPTAGITIDKINIHDNDGITTTDLANSTMTGKGAITLGNHTNAAKIFKLDTQGGDIGVNIDAGSAGTNATLNVKVTLPDDLKITTGDIGVAVSAGVGAATSTSNHKVILDSLDVTLGETALNVQLGHEAQGAMIKLSSTMSGGLKINNIKLNDAGGTVTGGSLFVEELKVAGTGANGDLELGLNIDIDEDGLVITDTSTTKNNVFMKGVVLGTAPTVTGLGTTADPYVYNRTASTKAIGDVELLGLSMQGSTIRISGK